ncbi:MAG: biopolymer transporter ExbD [Rikenellaceae bacterium]
MAIKRGSKIETSFGSASMTDLMFLLLIFLLVATTLINNNALEIMLPKSSSNQNNNRATATISVTKDLQYYIDEKHYTFAQLEGGLQNIFKGEENPLIMLNIDERIVVGELTKVIEEVQKIAKNNKYQMFLMTKP